MKRKLIFVVPLLLLIAAALIGACYYPAQPVPTQPTDDFFAPLNYPAGCYREQGGLRIVCTSSGSEIEMGAASLLDVQAGATVVFATPPAMADGYPLESAISGREFIGGKINNVMSATVAPTVLAMSTVTAFGCSVQNPTLSTGWTCGINIGASNQLTITVYEIDATPVPTASVRNVSWWATGN